MEYIIIMDKESHRRQDKSGQNDITSDEFLRFTSNCWYIQPEHDRSHPAPFPVELPYRVIKLYTWPGDIVLDPFCGSGTTCLAGKILNRHYIGIEINLEYCKMAERRLKQHHTLTLKIDVE
jgi:DNA modification methylase